MSTENKVLVGEIQRLAQVLAASDMVKRLDTRDEPGAWRLAYALVEIRHSFARLDASIMPALEAANESIHVDNSLHEIGEELRHVLYHIKDSGYFDYLL